MGDFKSPTYTMAGFQKAFNTSDASSQGWTLVAYAPGTKNVRIEVQDPSGGRLSHSFNKDGKDGVTNTGKSAISDKLFNRKFG